MPEVPPDDPLSLNDLKRTIPLSDQWERVRLALKNDSPRSAALLAAAHLDNLLETTLRLAMTENSLDKQESLFIPGGALSSTDVKVNLLYCYGIFGEVTRKDLKIICTIRNIFAHSGHPVNFSYQAVMDKCKELTALSKYMSVGRTVGDYLPSDDPREHFINTTMGVGLEVLLSGYLALRSVAQTHANSGSTHIPP